ncbi:MAG: hypothetical protein Q8P27_00790 [Candidatus Peregrinibacteria bacterium]|nr:hypothetical protein [Candidatus Peregrinibacteria bacterium]
MAKESKSNTIPLIIGLVVMGITGWYGYNKFNELSDVKETVELTDDVLFDVESESREITENYQDAKKNSVDTYSENKEKIDTVFPEKEDLTSFTRALDDFSFENHYSSNPFFVSQLTYGDVVSEDDYRYIPITMTLETSEKNLYKFIEYVNNSGSLDNGVRLMAINAITLQLSEDEDTLKVQLSLYAYIQNI